MSVEEASISEGSSDRKLEPEDSDHELLSSLIEIPKDDKVGFSLSKLWAFTGPGFLISIAFLDPGNLQLALITGATTRYKLLWILLWTALIGIHIQKLSARVGVVTGRHLAQICHTEYRFAWRLLIWLMMEIAIISADMQEVIGTATAIYLLSQGTIQPWCGVIFTVAEVFLVIFFDKCGLRKLELFFACLIITMIVSFGVLFFMSNGDYIEIVVGIVVPGCKDCSSEDIRQGEQIVGMFVVPHTLYLHSGLVKTRNIDRRSIRKIKEANYYYLIEMSVALITACFINLLIMTTFAKLLYNKTNHQIFTLCQNKSFLDTVFPDTNETAITNIESGGVLLGCKYGRYSLIIWSIGMLASGQSSTMTDCYTGQFVMEGFLNLKWVRWKRVVLTRAMALLPTLYIANYANLTAMSQLNDFLNIISDMQIPFALLPLIAFSSNIYIMGPFANGWCDKIIGMSIFILITALNSIFINNYIKSLNTWNIYSKIICTTYGVIYIVLCCYLVLHTVAALTSPSSFFNTSKFMKKYILGESMKQPDTAASAET